MPELPDLLYVAARLREAIGGRHVRSERVREPIVLRYKLHGNLSLLLGHRLDAIERHSHFLVFRFEVLDLAVNPMLAGRFRLAKPGEKDEGTLAFALGFDDDVELRYLDDKKMGKAYLCAANDWDGIPQIAAGGIDILSAHFTPERLVSLLKQRRDQVRVFLMDKSALDSFGNAYADEALFAAGIHPKTFCRALSHDDALRLHAAIVTVMTNAVAEVERRAEPTHVKVRDFLSVRRKEICPRCGARIRKAGVRGMDAYFCPHCQPATRAGMVDWTRTGK